MNWPLQRKKNYLDEINQILYNFGDVGFTSVVLVRQYVY
jgi:hypothetical protein